MSKPRIVLSDGIWIVIHTFGESTTLISDWASVPKDKHFIAALKFAQTLNIKRRLVQHLIANRQNRTRDHVQ